jgi:hypothetical protein
LNLVFLVKWNNEKKSELLMKPSMALKNQNKNGKLKKNGKPKMRLWKKLLLGFLATL